MLRSADPAMAYWAPKKHITASSEPVKPTQYTRNIASTCLIIYTHKSARGTPMIIAEVSQALDPTYTHTDVQCSSVHPPVHLATSFSVSTIILHIERVGLVALHMIFPREREQWYQYLNQLFIYESLVLQAHLTNTNPWNVLDSTQPPQ